MIELTASTAYRIAVPLANPANVRPLITLACGLAGDRRSEIVAFCVLRDRVRSEVGGGRSPVAQANERLALAVEAAHRWEVPVRTEVVAHRDVVAAISEKTREIGANLLVMGWRAGSPRSGGFRAEEVDRIVEHAGCDVAILKPAARAGAFRRVLVTDLRGEHSALAAEFGMAIAERFNGELHRLELVRPGTQGSEAADVSIVRAEDEKPAERPRLMVAHSTTEGILGAARGFDLVIVGMERRGLSRQLLYGNRLEAISSRANASILVVRSAASPTEEVNR